METLRTSSYLIPVKLESEAGKYMLIHGTQEPLTSLPKIF